MAYRKEAERELARRLRGRGLSLREIANQVDVALSTVSLWVRDIPVGSTTRIKTRSPAATSTQLELGDRRCGRCRRELPLTEFNRHSSGHQWWCRDCYRAYFRARGQLHRHQTQLARDRRRRKARALVENHLARHPCSDCGEGDLMVLEFDHLRAKRGHIAGLIADGISLPQLRAEIDKCEVVCVNCHRIRTATRSSSWRTDPGSLDSAAGLTRGERRNMVHIRDVLTDCACVDCGDSRLIVLDFDHLGPKRGNVIALARRGCSLEVLRAEIARCEIRCGNCHRRRTVATLGHRNWAPEFGDEKCPRQDSNLQPSP
jgi:hypothetical protein